MGHSEKARLAVTRIFGKLKAPFIQLPTTSPAPLKHPARSKIESLPGPSEIRPAHRASVDKSLTDNDFIVVCRYAICPAIFKQKYEEVQQQSVAGCLHSRNLNVSRFLRPPIGCDAKYF
jgi:hypothetical protein